MAPAMGPAPAPRLGGTTLATASTVPTVGAQAAWSTYPGTYSVSDGQWQQAASAPSFAAPSGAYPVGSMGAPPAPSQSGFLAGMTPAANVSFPAPPSAASMFAPADSAAGAGSARNLPLYTDDPGAGTARRARSKRDDGPDHSSWRKRFNGDNADLEDYLLQVWRTAVYEGWSQHEAGHVLAGSLEGKALRVMPCLPVGTVTFGEVARQLRLLFTPTTNRRQSEREFKARIRQPTESVTDYAFNLRILGRRAFPDMDFRRFETMLIDQFIDGQPYHLAYGLATHEKRSMEEAIDSALALEVAVRPRQLPPAPAPASAVPAQAATPPPVKASQVTPWQDPVVREPAREPTQQWVSAPAPSTGAPAHAAPVAAPRSPSDECDMEEYDLGAAQMIAHCAGLEAPGPAECCAFTSGPAQNRPCYFCGKQGHFWLKCPELLERLRSRGYQGALPGPQRRNSFRSGPPGQQNRNPRQGN